MSVGQYRTEPVCLDRVRRFILFHGKRRPAEMGAPGFLKHPEQPVGLPQ